MSDYYECWHCEKEGRTENRFVIEWGRIECIQGHGLGPSLGLGLWRNDIEVCHAMALKDNALMDVVGHNAETHSDAIAVIP